MRPCASVYVCESLPVSLYICITGNCICYRPKVSPFYCNSSIYNLYLFFIAQAEAQRHCTFWNDAQAAGPACAHPVVNMHAHANPPICTVYAHISVTLLCGACEASSCDSSTRRPCIAVQHRYYDWAVSVTEGQRRQSSYLIRANSGWMRMLSDSCLFWFSCVWKKNICLEMFV